MRDYLEVGAEFLEHYGVKGMQWGKRKSSGGGTPTAKGDIARAVLGGPLLAPKSTVRTAKRAEDFANNRKAGKPARKAARAKKATRVANAIGDYAWMNSVYSEAGAIRVHNNVARNMNSTNSPMQRLNNSPKYKGKNLNTDAKLKTTYNEDQAKVSQAAYQKAVKEVHGTNVSGTKKAVYVNDASGERIELQDTKPKAKHAAEDSEPDIVLLLKRDSTGHIIEINEAELDKLEQGEEFINSLFHFGVKGMKWGQRMQARKANVAAANATREAAKNAPKDVTVNSQLRRNKYKTKAKGGQKQPVTEDAVKAYTSRQKLKKSGVDALSNKELQELSTRMNLEQQVRSLDSKRPKSQKDKFVEEALKDPQKTYEKASKGAEALQKLRTKQE